MTRISIATVAALLCVPALALELEFGTAPTGDGGRGFGILAEYGAGGPKTITITRTTLPGFPKPNYWTRWGRLCNLTVYDPDGFSAAYLEMGDQSAATETYTLKVPEGKAGVWRVSVSGGLAPSGRFGGDTFKIVMPDSACWGVRGEKILKLIGDSLPSKMYLAFLPQNDEFYLTGNNVAWTFGGGQAIEGEEGSSLHGARAIQAHRGDNEILELAIDPAKKAMNVFVDGLPQTLSPTPEMARRLKGGAVPCTDGLYVEGPLQVKLRNYMLKFKPEDFACEVASVTNAIDGNQLRNFTNLVVDAREPDYGRSFRFRDKEGRPMRVGGHDFFHYGNNNYNSGMFSDLAARLGTKSLVNRALLSGFADLWDMDSAGIIRNSGYPGKRPLTGGRLDCATMFEICVGICRGYAKLKPLMMPEEERLYREGVIQVLVKQQGFMCYESNQWMHILEGFNEVFCATGDARLERALNMQLRAFMANDFHGKHGQHPAGFFSEEYGPDGNYDQMSSRPMSVIYHTYSQQPTADPELVLLMKDCLEKNFRFRSVFAVPDPASGQPYQLAYAMNHRTDGPTHFDSHHTLSNCSNDFPMAYTIAALGQPWRNDARCLKLPCEVEGVSFDRPGFTALRRGNFYGVQFWKVYDEGSDGFLGPLFLWHAKAGMGVCGVKHSYGKRHSHWFGPEMDKGDLTFPTVFGELDGKFYEPSRKMKKTFAWDEYAKRYTVTGTAYQPPKSRTAQPLVRGMIAWTTDFVSDDAVEMEIAVDFPDLKDATVNIPLLKQLGRTVWSSGGWRKWTFEKNRLVMLTASGSFTLTVPEGLEAEAVDDLYGTRGWAMAVRVKVPASGKVRVRLEASELKAIPFKDGDRVVFWGDSITHGGTYPKMISDFYLTRYPESTIRFYNAGVSGDNAGDAFSRFGDDIVRRAPTAVTYMFGMNDSWRGNYHPDKLADPAHRAALPELEHTCYTNFVANMDRLVRETARRFPAARKIFLTPTPTDDTCRPADDGQPPVPPLTGTVAALGRFADFEKDALRHYGAELVDFLDPFTNLVAREQAKNPAFTLLRRDRVHPTAPGHLVMTYEFLRQQGVRGSVSEVLIQAKNATAVSEALKNATVSDIRWEADANRLSFTMLEGALPWPMQPDAVAALDLVPVTDELNREILAVQQLPEGRYALTIDGTEVGEWDATELAAGVNLARNEKTPQFKQAALLEEKNAARCEIERNKLRMIAASRRILRKQKVNPDDLGAVQRHYDGLSDEKRNGYFERRFPDYIAEFGNKAALEDEQEARYDELLKLRQPVPHRYVLEAR